MSLSNWLEYIITMTSDELDVKVVYFSSLLFSERNGQPSRETRELGQAGLQVQVICKKRSGNGRGMHQSRGFLVQLVTYQ